MGDRSLCAGLQNSTEATVRKDGGASRAKVGTASIASKDDLSTRLLAGAILGLGIGLFGLFNGLSTGDKAPFLGWLWGCSLAQHSHRFTDADHDLPHFQFPLDSRCTETARTRTRRISMARTLPFAASPCGLVRRRTIRDFVDLDQSRCPNHRGQFRDQRKGRRFTPKESLYLNLYFFSLRMILFWHFLRTRSLAKKFPLRRQRR